MTVRARGAATAASRPTPNLPAPRWVLVALAAVALAGCGTPTTDPPAARDTSFRHPTFPPRTAVPTPTPATSPVPEPSGSAPAAPDAVPERFPLPPGASPALVDDAVTATIARWSVPMSGYDVYGFYAAELPRAGFPIVGLYPGGAGAIIRFETDDARVLQVYMTGDLETTDLRLRADVP